MAGQVSADAEQRAAGAWQVNVPLTRNNDLPYGFLGARRFRHGPDGRCRASFPGIDAGPKPGLQHPQFPSASTGYPRSRRPPRSLDRMVESFT